MEKKEKIGVFVLVLWMLIIIVGVGKAHEEAPNNIFSETVKSAEAVSPNPNSYWEEVRKLVNKAYTYLFPPKIDFRPGKPVEDGGVSVNGNGNGNGNVKEAVTKSFQKTKEMVEDSAKAAGETLQQQQQQPPPHSEL